MYQSSGLCNQPFPCAHILPCDLLSSWTSTSLYTMMIPAPSLPTLLNSASWELVTTKCADITFTQSRCDISESSHHSCGCFSEHQQCLTMCSLFSSAVHNCSLSVHILVDQYHMTANICESVRQSFLSRVTSPPLVHCSFISIGVCVDSAPSTFHILLVSQIWVPEASREQDV